MRTIAQFFVAISKKLNFIYLLLVNQLRAVIDGKISRWLEFLMHDYMTVRRKESRCPSIKHLYTKKNSSVWMIISFLKNGFLFFLFNKKGLYWKVVYSSYVWKKKLHFPSWPGFWSEKSIRLGYTRFFFSFLHLSRFTITTNSFTKSTTYWAVCKHSELGQLALNFELIASGLSSLGQLMLKQF